MKRFALKKGLDVPISGEPKQEISVSPILSRAALLGDDYIDLKPTMEVREGDHVKTGQLLLRDKKNVGVVFTSPATGRINSINRGAKRKFESIVIDLEEDDFISFLAPGQKLPSSFSEQEIRTILVESSLWTSFRTRPYGKIPGIDTSPAALFITAMDTRPLAANPALIIDGERENFSLGLQVLEQLTDSTTYLCVNNAANFADFTLGTIEMVEFSGPHPSGLPSTHIHFLKAASENRTNWHIDYQDVIGIGHLFATGHLPTEKTISIAGPGVLAPKLVRVRRGGDIYEICKDQLISTPNRLLSGSILDGRRVEDFRHFIGRYHYQISALHEGSGRSLFSWALPGSERFSLKTIFSSALHKSKKFAMNTALWGGERAIYPIDSYDRVMPLDILPLTLLKSISVGDTEKSKELGALELIEEDVALLSYVCPGKNDFGPMLRDVLSEIELGG